MEPAQALALASGAYVLRVMTALSGPRIVRVHVCGLPTNEPDERDERRRKPRGRRILYRPALRTPALNTSKCLGSCTARKDKTSMENFGKNRISSAPASRAPSASWRCALLAASRAWPSHHSDLLESPVSCRNEISLYKYASDSAE